MENPGNKKKILIVAPTISTDGPSKSLLALLMAFDYKKYNIDLLLFEHNGLLMPYLPSEVKLLPPLLDSYDLPLKKALPKLLKEKRFNIVIGRVSAALLSRIGRYFGFKGIALKWFIYKNLLSEPKQFYDFAISYQDYMSNYYVAEKVSAKRIILNNRMNYGYSSNNGKTSLKLDQKVFRKCDYIITVSDSSKDALKEYFPEISKKIKVMNNMVPVQFVREMAEEREVFEGIANAKVKIVTVARLAKEKGVDLAIEACDRLVNDHQLDIKWYLIGTGPMKKELEAQIRQKDLDKHFVLVGEVPNPYPYMTSCDIYVQPSRTEGYCNAVQEALVLCCPIVVTDIPSFRQQIEDGKTGLIVQLSAEGITNGVKVLISNPEMSNQFKKNLFKRDLSNKNEIFEFYDLST